MNKEVCKKCRRYGGDYPGGLSRGWTCAKEIFMERSLNVPGFSHVVRHSMHPMTEERKVPPEWCEHPLEQVMLSDQEAAVLRKDDALQYDGNKAAAMHAERNHWSWPQPAMTFSP